MDLLRDSGELWQEGDFRDDVKHGKWKRYDREGGLEYQALFENGKLVKRVL